MLWLQQVSRAALSPVVTSGFMGNNTHALFVPAGESGDWIELHNVSPAPVNLLNWSLTDNAGNLTKWRLPTTNLNVDAYLIVFADGKNKRVPGAPLHASFKLSTEGGYLALVQPDGTT